MLSIKPFTKQILSVSTLIVVILVIWHVGLINKSFAESDCAAYNTCPTPIPTYQIELTKEIKPQDSTTFTHEATLTPGNNAEFKISIKNRGQAVLNRVVISDLLPVEFKLISGSRTNLINDLKVNETKVFILQTQVDPNLTKAICLKNIALAEQNQIVLAQDEVKVCITQGNVLGSIDLQPGTAVTNWMLVIPGLTSIGVGGLLWIVAKKHEYASRKD